MLQQVQSLCRLSVPRCCVLTRHTCTALMHVHTSALKKRLSMPGFLTLLHSAHDLCIYRHFSHLTSTPSAPCRVQVIADCCLDEREMALIREKFSFLDVDRDGHITVDDLINGLRSRGIPVLEEDARAMFAAVSHSASHLYDQ